MARAASLNTWAPSIAPVIAAVLANEDDFRFSTKRKTCVRSNSPCARVRTRGSKIEGIIAFARVDYGYATEYRKSVHAKCFLNSWYFRGYGMLFRLFYAIRHYSRTRMSRRFLIQGISYNRMRTRTPLRDVLYECNLALIRWTPSPALWLAQVMNARALPLTKEKCQALEAELGQGDCGVRVLMLYFTLIHSVMTCFIILFFPYLFFPYLF